MRELASDAAAASQISGAHDFCRSLSISQSSLRCEPSKNPAFDKIKFCKQPIACCPTGVSAGTPPPRVSRAKQTHRRAT